MKISLIICNAILLIGCSKEPIIRTEYKTVNVPVKCTEAMPSKPRYIKGNLKSARDLMAYYKKCELILINCIKDN